jgi:hypothetical protein
VPKLNITAFVERAPDSAAMYLYAAECVRQQATPFFDEMRAVQSGLLLRPMKK